MVEREGRQNGCADPSISLRVSADGAKSTWRMMWKADRCQSNGERSNQLFFIIEQSGLTRVARGASDARGHPR